MINMLPPRVLKRGLEIFAILSVLGFVGLLFYGNNLDVFIQTMLGLQWGWVVVGVLLATSDWFGGGLRLWILIRHVFPGASLKGSILAGGMTSWATYLTPSQTGGGPLMIYTLKRYGTPIPEAMIASLMTFVATVVFFAVAGPVALALGAGKSLEEHGVLGSLTLYDLFRLSLGGFIFIGVLMLVLIVFPGFVAQLARRIVGWFEARGNPKMAERVSALREGIDRSHHCLVQFFRGTGWLALAAAVPVSGLAFANRLLGGYVVLRMLSIEANFVDVLLLQTLITFLLYFMPTPGGAGLAEILSAAVMSIYVPRELTPSYILLWRTMLAYLTVGFGSVVFWSWLRGAADRLDTETSAE